MNVELRFHRGHMHIFLGVRRVDSTGDTLSLTFKGPTLPALTFDIKGIAEIVLDDEGLFS